MWLSCQYRGVGASGCPSELPVRQSERRVPLLVLVSVAVPLLPWRFAHAVLASALGCRPASPQRPTPGSRPHKPPALLRLTSHPSPLVGVKPANTHTLARPWPLLLLSGKGKTGVGLIASCMAE